jgi:hypothetical protein
VPVVSVAAAAPAYAVISSHGPLQSTTAEFYVVDNGDETFGVVPYLTIYNPRSAPAHNVLATMIFPVADFQGVNTFTDPPTPGETNSHLFDDQGWTMSWEDPEPGDSDVYIDFALAGQLAGGSIASLGAYGGPTRASLDFRQDPTAQSIAVAMSATFPDATSTSSLVLSRTSPPR